jgi:hypothetical protein
MKHCYKCKTCKDESLFGKNKSKSDGLATECRDCKRKQDKEYISKNREAAKERASIWYYANKEYALEQRRIIGKKWRTENKEKNSAKNARYRTSKLNATPKWLTKEHHNQIESVYWLAQLQRELTDTKYHVDHIVPLKGKTVCGLHVPWNLQVLEALDNISKGNRIVL